MINRCDRKDRNFCSVQLVQVTIAVLIFIAKYQSYKIKLSFLELLYENWNIESVY